MTKEVTLDAKIENIDKAVSFLNAELDNLKCDPAIKTKIDVAVDEIFSNIANYAYKPVEGKVTIKFDETDDGKQVEIMFIDSGKPYDPLKKQDPNINLSLDEREAGGLGIYIVKKSMDKVFYEYKDNKNILTLVKKL